MKLSLVVLNAGKASGQTIPIRIPQFVIGRDPQCNLRPGSAMISKKHCAFVVHQGKVLLRDFDSTNGTFLNDQPVKGDVPVKHDDVVKVGPLTFRVVIEASAAPSKPTPLPKPASKGSEEDDAAALLLSLDDGTLSTAKDTDEGNVPGGSTVMDIPSVIASGQGGSPSAKDDNKNKDEKAHDSASQAAAALIDKMRKGARR
jgi:pSer/pThr/pTyr-binding forkhead associated (FHA) protein